ncbi:MAG: hypothetical protein AABW73_02955 [Nanoarchaeota archaeon]
MKNKRGQDEIVGFIIIVLLVSVVALVFFGITLRKTAPIESSVRLENFAGAALGVTTDCSIKKVPSYLDLEDLIKECRKGTSCYDGKKTCELLNKTVGELLDSTFPINGQAPTNYYSFKAYYQQNTSQGSSGGVEFYTTEKGKCEGTKSGNTQSISSLPGVIRVETQICSSSA